MKQSGWLQLWIIFCFGCISGSALFTAFQVLSHLGFGNLALAKMTDTI
jgi:hypothetical protein